MNPANFPNAGAFGVIGRHFWVAALVVGAINGWIQWKRIAERIQDNPGSASRYRRLFKGYLFWTNLPWLLMGLGILTGRVSSVFEYLMPGAGNPMVLGWYCALGLELIIGTCWIVIGRGAETLVAFPGLPFVPHLGARGIRLSWLGLCVWNVSIFLYIFFQFGSAGKGDSILSDYFPFLFAGMWILVVYAGAATSGWRSLAAFYEFQGRFPCRMFSGGGRMGGMTYGGCLRIGADQNYLYISVLLPFRPGHPKLAIPWSEITSEEKSGLFGTRTDMRFLKAPQVAFSIPQWLAGKLEHAPWRAPKP